MKLWAIIEHLSCQIVCFIFKFHFYLFVFVHVGERATEGVGNGIRMHQGHPVRRSFSDKSTNGSLDHPSQHRSVDTNGWIWHNFVLSRKWLDAKTFVWLFGKAGETLLKWLPIKWTYKFHIYKFKKSDFRFTRVTNFVDWAVVNRTL